MAQVVHAFEAWTSIAPVPGPSVRSRDNRTSLTPNEYLLQEQMYIFMVPVMKIVVLIALTPLCSAAFGCVQLDGDVFSPRVYAVFLCVFTGALVMTAVLLGSSLFATLFLLQVPPSTRYELRGPWRETGLLLAELTVVVCTYMLAWMDAIPVLQDPISGRPVLVMRYLGWGASFPLLVDLDIRVAMRRPAGTPGKDALCAFLSVLFGLWGHLMKLVMLRWFFIVLSWLACFVVLISIQKAKHEGCEQLDVRQFAKLLLTAIQLGYVCVGVIYHLALAGTVTIDFEQIVLSLSDVVFKILHCLLVLDMVTMMHLTRIVKRDDNLRDFVDGVDMVVVFLARTGQILNANKQARKIFSFACTLRASCLSVTSTAQGSDGEQPLYISETMLHHWSTSFEDTQDQVMETCRPSRVTVELMSGLVIDGTMTPTFSETGGVCGVVWSGHARQSSSQPRQKELFTTSLNALLNSMRGPAFAIEEPEHRVVAWTPEMQELLPRPQGRVCLGELPFLDEESRATAEAALRSPSNGEMNEVQNKAVTHVLLSVPAASGGIARSLRMSCTRFDVSASHQSDGFVVVFCCVSCWRASVANGEAWDSASRQEGVVNDAEQASCREPPKVTLESKSGEGDKGSIYGKRAS